MLAVRFNLPLLEHAIHHEVFLRAQKHRSITTSVESYRAVPSTHPQYFSCCA
jgi:hypothetical protein